MKEYLMTLNPAALKDDDLRHYASLGLLPLTPLVAEQMGLFLADAVTLSEYAEAAERCEDLGADVKQMEADLDRLKDEIERLEAEVERLEAEVERLEYDEAVVIENAEALYRARIAPLLHRAADLLEYAEVHGEPSARDSDMIDTMTALRKEAE